MAPQNTPDFIPESRPDFIPDTPKKAEPTPGQRASPKSEPGRLPNGSYVEGTYPEYRLLGDTAPLTQQLRTAGLLSNFALMGTGLGDSLMGLPPPRLGSLGLPSVPSVGDVADFGTRLGGALRAGVRAAIFGPPEKPPAEPIVQPLSESPNYPQILAGRALARQQARETLMPRKLEVPPEEPNVQSLSNSPNYPQILAGRALARQQARETLMPRTLEAPKPSPLDVTAQPSKTTFAVSEGRPATWTNERVIQLAKQGNRLAIEQATRRGLELPPNARYIMGDPNLSR